MTYKNALKIFYLMALLIPVAAMAEAQAGDSQSVVFREDFNDEALSEQWEVRNANPDSMIIEDGKLQIVTEVPKNGIFDPQNFVVYNKDLPKNYEIDVKVLLTQMEGSCAYWTNTPLVGLLLSLDAKNNISLLASHSTNRCGSSSDAATFSKMKNGAWQPGFSRDIGGQTEGREVLLRLVRQKFKYYAYYNADGKNWVKLGEFSDLKPKYTRIGLIAPRGGAKTHETIQKVDWIEIREVK